MDHSYEEIRSAALDLLSGRERSAYELSQYQNFQISMADIFGRRESAPQQRYPYTPLTNPGLSAADRDTFLEVFWGLFREGIITLGMNDSNREFPWFRVSEYGRRLLKNTQTYFFHDVSSYENLIRKEIPQIDATTVLYLQEAMQAFRSGAILAATVMLGVATEHTFLLLLESATSSTTHGAKFAKASKERIILPKINGFKKVVDSDQSTLPSTVREDLDTNFTGILSIIRTFRNQSRHPSGKIIDREQCYVLLQLFIPYAKKMYQLKDHYQ